MYVTRPLSIYTKSPDAALEPPPEGPNSGYLTFMDEESEAERACCWGTCKSDRLKSLPFPHNKILTVEYIQHPECQMVRIVSNKALFIPVLDQPLSSNRYYVINANAKFKGKAHTCSREVDGSTCCFCTHIIDKNPQDFDHRDVYQQVEIRCCRSGGYIAKSVAPDGFPPFFLRRKGWKIYTRTPVHRQLGEAHGANTALRVRLPEFDFPLSSKRSASIVVGKWYCPFMFIKEVYSLKFQMERSMFYEMRLERLWEEIHTCENDGNEGNTVVVSATIRSESAKIFGVETVQEDAGVVDGMMWLREPLTSMEERMSVGLNMAIVDRMKWEACKGGWIDGKERDVKVEKVEEFGGRREWRKFGCYVLVERFALKRMDGSSVLDYDFRHTHVVQSKWE
ncbi:uncharacterized protein LOC131257971 [Magnolia sinica]|uniref:uncharacterized protein LOC131257971 n=1 Tax=Magnolia sinica TaxID=86752 RepID=UPI00265B0B40|nr:uncharacterized protein LOC131257971 [Magnolia sinica]